MNSSIDTFQNRGFTLLELLVVIAIVGVLATVILLTVGETRLKAADAAAFAQARELLTPIATCELEGFTVSQPPLNGNGGGAICSGGTYGSRSWPPLPEPWEYENNIDPSTLYVLVRREFFSVSVAIYRISCTLNGCAFSGPAIQPLI